jgi:cyclophilin family peptidyl-prolyl cis-trans isomerase
MTTWRFSAATFALLAILVASSIAGAAPASQPARKSKVTGPAAKAPQAPASPAAPGTQMQALAVPLAQQMEAELRVWHPVYQVGQPVWIEFTLRNLTENPLTLQVPNALAAEVGPPTMGLPLPHVFSGAEFAALQITRESDQNQGMPVLRQPTGPVAPLVLAPFASIGVHVDASKWYPMLRQPGEYKLQWKPYNGLLASNAVNIKIANFKDAVIRTEFGTMRVRLFYEKAPKTVENFLALVQKSFYDSMTFHRLVPGFILQGGSPTGDDTGVRPDGTRLKAEFNGTPFERGTIAMARSQSDPDSASSQFFICLSRQPSLDGQYTAFGQLVGTESFETLSKMEQTEVAANAFGEKSKPAKILRIQSVTLENAPRPPTRINPLGGPSVSPGLASGK